MAGSVNKVILVGNVGKDPEVRRTQDGKAIVSLTLATSETWRDKASGERKEKTEWHRVVVFSEPVGKIVEQYVKKGAKLYVEGKLQTRKWTDQSGADKYSTEVIIDGFGGALTMLDGKSDQGEQQSISQRAMPKGPSNSYARGTGRPDPITFGRAPLGNDMDDEIPFAPEFR